jgi:hypothetical protein
VRNSPCRWAGLSRVEDLGGWGGIVFKLPDLELEDTPISQLLKRDSATGIGAMRDHDNESSHISHVLPL